MANGLLICLLFRGITFSSDRVAWAARRCPDSNASNFPVLLQCRTMRHIIKQFVEAITTQKGISAFFSKARQDSNMHFRLGGKQDLALCAALLKANQCFKASDKFYERLESLWLQMLERKLFCGFVIWEDPALPDDKRILSFAMSVVVDDDFAGQLESPGIPWAAMSVYEAVSGSKNFRGPLCDQQQIARANAEDGVNLLVLHNPMRIHQLSDPRNQPLLPLGAKAFYFAHDGYYTKAVYWEVYGEEHANFLANGGYRELHDYSSHPHVADILDDRIPYLYKLDRSDSVLGYLPNNLWLFMRKIPKLGFTQKQQELLLYALSGQSDRELQNTLGVSEDAIKQAWKNIMHRAVAAQPIRFAQESSDSGGRGQSRRHLLLTYLRQHMEELRPYRYETGKVDRGNENLTK